MVTGTAVFGPACRIMLERDVHAPGSVDRVLAERMVLVTPENRAEFLRSPPPAPCEVASRPELERILETTAGTEIPAFTATLAARAPASIDDMLFGGTEEEIIRRGSDWCTDLARVACALFQVAGVPARIVFLADLDQAYSCHVVTEAFLDGGWVRLDAVTGERCPEPDPRAAAVADYLIADHDRFDFTVTKVSDYYRTILEMAERGWPGGLRWLFGEGGTCSRDRRAGKEILMNVDRDWRAKIHSELARIEREHGVTILYACESGSRAWGFPSRDSDYDVRMVYHHTLDWYVDLQQKRDVIEEPIHDLLDIAGWDLDKTLRLLRKSNPNILEWTESPIVYRETESFVLVHELLQESFDHRASILHYLNMGVNNKRDWLGHDEVKIKKYLYCIRPLLCALWVQKHDSQPPMLYHELLADLYPGTRLENELETMIAMKLDMNELDVVPRNVFLNEWVEETVADIQDSIPDKQPTPSWEPYNRVFRTIVG